MMKSTEPNGQQDIKAYSHIGDIAFEPVYDETIEADADCSED